MIHCITNAAGPESSSGPILFLDGVDGQLDGEDASPHREAPLVQEWSEPFELAGGHPRKRDIPERASDSGGFGATLPFPFTSIAKCVRDDLLGGHGLSHRYCSRLAPRCLDECPLGGEGRAERVGGEGLAGTSQGLDLLRYLPTALPLGYPEVVIHLQPEPEGGTYPRPAR